MVELPSTDFSTICDNVKPPTKSKCQRALASPYPLIRGQAMGIVLLKHDWHKDV